MHSGGTDILIASLLSSIVNLPETSHGEAIAFEIDCSTGYQSIISMAVSHSKTLIHFRLTIYYTLDYQKHKFRLVSKRGQINHPFYRLPYTRYTVSLFSAPCACDANQCLSILFSKFSKFIDTQDRRRKLQVYFPSFKPLNQRKPTVSHAEFTVHPTVT